MGIESFESKDDDFSEARVERPNISAENNEKVRPYVSREVHERINLFSANSGLPMQLTYDKLLNTSVTNTHILELILTDGNEYSGDLSDSELDLLSDIAEKVEELQRFPTRQEINQDRELNGFPIYITYLGKRERIKQLILDEFSDELTFDLDV